MRISRTNGVLALTAVLVVVWSAAASANNGNPLIVGHATTATAQTTLSTTQSSKPGLVVTLAGSSKGAGVKGNATGAGNGVQGASVSGIGVVATTKSGAKAALSAKNTGGGPAASFRVPGGVAPFTVSSSAEVTNLNAGLVDGASIVSNRVIEDSARGDVILQIPGFGDVEVDACDGSNASFSWKAGTAAYVTWFDIPNPGEGLVQAVATQVSTGSEHHHFVTAQLARDTGAATSIVSLTVTASAVDCTFAAQAVVQPG
ncbi:MAG TPA: hypothetical protein VNN79_13175 [Actinomycetota bacterium]|nr:hypothetical protein [Actinomycetota bacterium]